MKNTRQKKLKINTLGLALLLLETGVWAQDVDHETGLIIDDNLELVKTNCTVCHSAQNIIRQNGTRLTWLGLIRWMQTTQGLWEFDADTETKILDYLETNYGLKKVSYRRAPLSPFLMPPNPYQTQASLTFIGLSNSYQTGSTLNIDVTVDFQETYSKGRLDLWVAVHLPNTPASEFLFLTGTPSTPSFSLKPQAFQGSLETIDNTYSVLKDFLLTSNLNKGKYTFYTLLVEAGTNPLENAEINRSNLAIQVTVVQ